MLNIKLLVALSALLGLAAIASASGISFIGGKAMMPLSSIKDRFGAKIIYQNKLGIAIKLDYRTAFLRPGYRQVRVDRKNYLLDEKVVVINGVTYVPVSFMNKAFGYKYDWNDRQQRMTFTNKAKKRVVIDCDHRDRDRDRGRDNHRNDRDCKQCAKDKKGHDHHHR